MAQRSAVLKLYRTILRFGQKWTATTAKETSTERSYITNETKQLFRKNQNLTDPKSIADCIQEAQARVDLAMHYKNPYPRPVNVPPSAMAKKAGKEEGSTQQRIKQQGKSIYIKSKLT